MGATQSVIEERVFIRDLKPFCLPAEMSDLRGPSAGVIELPHSVFWGKAHTLVDLSDLARVKFAYGAILNEGTEDDLVSLVNPDLLASTWGDLFIARHVRSAWEEAFPHLLVGQAA